MNSSAAAPQSVVASEPSAIETTQSHRLSDEEVRSILATNGIVVADDQWKRLKHWRSCMEQQNQKLNLVSRKDIDRLFEKHLLHSLAILAIREFPQGAKVCDVGTGGGLPGIPLAIVRPDLQWVLIDSIRKKINAVETFVADLQLSNVTPLWGRAEVIGKEPQYCREFSIITARAVASLASLEGWTRDLRQPKAVLHAYKGGEVSEEIQAVQSRRGVKRVEETLLELIDHSELAADGKKVVTLRFA